MPHNNKTLTSSYSKWDAEYPCGKVIQFNSETQRKIWTKLHKKNCGICSPLEMTIKSPVLKLTN
jgi:hypothetical protein